MENYFKKPELLAPAGNFEKLKIALTYGADAVYLGDTEFSLRGKAKNFNLKEIEKASQYVHKHNKKIYVTINIFAKNKDFAALYDYISMLNSINIDGIIVSDPGVVDLCNEISSIPLILSTQANTLNKRSVLFWEKQNIKRIILARELSFEEIKDIRKSTKIELEVFIHGSLCISYSGRCHISEYLTKRSANRGECTNSCRWKYALMEENRPNEYMPVYFDEKGTYLYNSKDLMLINRISDLINIGIDSFKIEGRMKTENYLATACSVYRSAIDSFIENQQKYIVKDEWVKELYKVKNREFITDFIGDSEDTTLFNKSFNDNKKYKYAGLILESNKNIAKVYVKNKIIVGQKMELFDGSFLEKKFILKDIKNYDGKTTNFANPNSVVLIDVGFKASKYNILRIIENE